MRVSAQIAAFAVLLAACSAPAPPAKLPVAVLVRATAAESSQIRSSLAAEQARGVELRFVDLPSNVGENAPTSDVEARLAAARKAYTLPDVPACLAALGDASVVPDLLVLGRRSAAARVLFWRLACLVAASSLPEARRAAGEFAAYALDVPPEVEAASPEAEAVLGRTIAEVSAAPAARLSVTTSVPGATLSADGREALCVTPCRVDLRPGPHVLVLRRDGSETARRPLTLAGGDSKLDVELAPAPPDLAAKQWASRYGAGTDIDSAASLTLLAQAVRARSLSFIDVTPRPPGLRIQGVLSVQGDTRARAERLLPGPETLSSALPSLFEELLREGKLVESVPLWKKPLFWGIAAAVAVTAAVITYAALYKPPVTTEVRF